MSQGSSYPDNHALRGYRLHALVDRVQLEVELVQRTQAHVLYRHLPRHWKASAVKALGGHSSGTDTRFSFWVQDPEGPDQIERDLAMVQSRFPLAAPIKIVAIEVAIDHYRQATPGAPSLEEAALYLVRNISRPPSERRVVTWKETWPSGGVWRRFAADCDPRESLRHLRAGHTVQIGEVDANDRVRVYVKTTDHLGQRAHEPLPQDQHRARLERTLSGASCPFDTLEAWRDFDFSRLAGLFTLRRWADRELPPTAKVLRERARSHGASGRPDDPAKRAQHRRMTRRGTCADQIAYEHVRAALRRLTTAQRNGREPLPEPVFGSVEAHGCGNSGEVNLASDPATEGSELKPWEHPNYISDLLLQCERPAVPSCRGLKAS